MHVHSLELEKKRKPQLCNFFTDDIRLEIDPRCIKEIARQIQQHAFYLISKWLNNGPVISVGNNNANGQGNKIIIKGKDRSRNKMTILFGYYLITMQGHLFSLTHHTVRAEVNWMVMFACFKHHLLEIHHLDC